MPSGLCLTPGCPRTPEVRGRCRPCATERRKQTRSRNDSFYASKPWRLTRRKQLFDFPLCQYVEDGTECGQLADSVHHIVELEDGGAPRHPDNLLSTCRSHHSAIHAERNGGRVAR